MPTSYGTLTEHLQGELPRQRDAAVRTPPGHLDELSPPGALRYGAAEGTLSAYLRYERAWRCWASQERQPWQHCFLISQHANVIGTSTDGCHMMFFSHYHINNV